DIAITPVRAGGLDDPVVLSATRALGVRDMAMYGSYAVCTTVDGVAILRMPQGDLQRLLNSLRNIEIIDCTPLVVDLRLVKSPAEVEKISYVCEAASLAFEDLPSWATSGESEREIVRRFRIELLERGCDSTPYVIAGSGPGGYESIIMGPGDRVLERGDVLIIDTGATFDGYFCDFDRNFAFVSADDEVKRAYEVVWQATEAGLAAARPGATAEDLFYAMATVLEEGGAVGNDVGRLGHGLGMNLTEWPSNRAGDRTPLRSGMVVTLEPGMLFAPGRMMVHEEDILITESAPKLLTRRATPDLPIIS
ncbi:MAG: Xaa-Pro peptidase family protein, partial [Kiloniellales bacterium]|nr:Xaa-Pro peptidase family protein [Kiloniellales bacterium]